MYWDYEQKNVSRAKALRKEMTPWERKLWYEFLRTRPEKFYRQRTVGNYILDFYCPQHHLAVELDGGGHYEPTQTGYDQHRTDRLEQLGIQVLRFCNTDVTEHFGSVCEAIDGALTAVK